jgi:outer membrane autotransporter protein
MPEFNMRDSMRSMQERAPSVSSSGSWTETWPNVDVRDSMRSVSDQVGSIDLSTEKPPVKKAWVSGGSESAVPSGWLRSLGERMPDLSPTSWLRSLDEQMPDLSPSLRLPTRYQTWGRAYVADVDQERADGFEGYDALVVGGVVGVDRRFDQAVLGLAGGLSEMTLTGANGNNGEATSLQGTAYASYFTDLFYLNAHVSYAVSDVETIEVEDFGYSADYDANNLSFFVGAGFGLKSFDDSVLFTPEVSLLSTRYARDGYTSSSAKGSSFGLMDREFESYDQWSHQSEVGAAVSMVRVLDSARLQMAFQPELRAHWVHQFEPEMDAESYRFTGSVDTLNAQLQAREEDLIRLGAGVRFWSWNSQTTEFGLNLDHLMGGSYAEWMVSGHFIHRF